MKKTKTAPEAPTVSLDDVWALVKQRVQVHYDFAGQRGYYVGVLTQVCQDKEGLKPFLVLAEGRFKKTVYLPVRAVTSIGKAT
jgi:hypothetical protein